MKAIIFVFLSVSAYSAESWFALEKEGAIERYISKDLCEKTENHECLNMALCFLDECSPQDEFVNGKPIISVTQKTECLGVVPEPVEVVAGDLPETERTIETRTDCEIAMAELVCDDGYEAHYRLDKPMAFCEKLLGYEQIKTGKRVLKPDPEKIAAKQARKLEEKTKKEEKEQRKRQAKQDIAVEKIREAKTIADLKKILEKLIESQE